MKTLAVINCKKSKAEHSCTAETMYSKSTMFRAMRDFVKGYYDEYVILSAEYGVVEPDEIISPYSKMIGGSGYAGVGEVNILTKEEEQEWARKVSKNSIWRKFDQIDFHVGQNYWSPLEKYFPKANVILLPSNTGLVVRHYQWLYRDMIEGREIDFTIRERLGMPAHPDKVWYHPIHSPNGEFFGNEASIGLRYNPGMKLDIPTLDMVDNGKKNCVNHHKGWCLRTEVLEKLYYIEEKDQWRTRK